MYRQAFGLTLPQLNHEVLLYKYITFLALPLEVFPAVQRLTLLTRSEFHYSTTKEIRRKQGSDFPELRLISLLVIAVKLLYPFDGMERHPRSIHEPTTQKIDWSTWQSQMQNTTRPLPGASLPRGSEIGLQDTDVFNMNERELDSYMDWYQKMWVKEPRCGFEDSVNKEILDMFPLPTLNQPVGQTSLQREQEVVKLAAQRTQSTTNSMKFQIPIPEEDISDPETNIHRPGEGYRSYKQEEDLPDSARAFFQAAAETACTSVKNLILAVQQAESRIATWKRAKRRAEVTGQDLDVDAEMGLVPEAKLEMQMSQEMEAMNIGIDSTKEEASEGDVSDVDMQMIS
jgi:RNA polymerase I-specific transcription initiation factor RRN7